MENPKNIEDIIILITESRTDFSLPYLVYTTKTIRAMIPIKRKIHAKSHHFPAYHPDLYGINLLSLFSHGDRLPGLSLGLAKTIHTRVYAVLSFLCFHSLSRSGIKRHCFLIALLLTSIYAISDEFHEVQRLVIT